MAHITDIFLFFNLSSKKFLKIAQISKEREAKKIACQNVVKQITAKS